LRNFIALFCTKGKSMVNKPVVLDLSHHNVVHNLQSVKDAGIVGIIHKATEGLTYRDDKYLGRRKGFTDIALRWGAYHFYHGGGAAEADFFLTVAQPDKATLVCLDWEPVPKNGTPSATAARAFLERIEEKLGRKAVVYSGNAAKEKIKGKDAYFGAHRLWLAQYGSKWKTQASWTRPWLWQYSENGKVAGIDSGGVDVNAPVAPTTTTDIIRDWAK
jgi:GH25 family lysozyme M1 (1,4-beta-N-acetylmuramidase)